jgi:hypothetical protein
MRQRKNVVNMDELLRSYEWPKTLAAGPGGDFQRATVALAASLGLYDPRKDGGGRIESYQTAAFVECVGRLNRFELSDALKLGRPVFRHLSSDEEGR